MALVIVLQLVNMALRASLLSRQANGGVDKDSSREGRSTTGKHSSRLDPNIGYIEGRTLSEQEYTSEKYTSEYSFDPCRRFRHGDRVRVRKSPTHIEKAYAHQLPESWRGADGRLLTKQEMRERDLLKTDTRTGALLILAQFTKPDGSGETEAWPIDNLMCHSLELIERASQRQPTRSAGTREVLPVGYISP